MKITEIEISVFEVPMYPAVTDVVEVSSQPHKRWKQSFSFSGPKAVPIQVMKVKTDDGIEGVSTVGDWRYTELTWQQISQLREIAIGEDPLKKDDLIGMLEVASRFFEPGWIGSFDNCLWDIQGKNAGLPVAELIGVPKRKVRAYYNIAGTTQDELLADGDSALEQGYSVLKDHLSFSVEENLDMFQNLRSYFGPNVGLMHDAALTSYTFNEALMVGKKLSSENFIWFEEPLRDRNIKECRELVDLLDIAVAGGETLMNEPEISKLWLDMKAFDIMRVNARHGSSNLLNMAAYCAKENATIEPNSYGPLFGLIHAHLACSIDNIHWFETSPPSNGPEIAKEIGLMNPIIPKEGWVTYPEGHGWGAQWDWDIFESNRLGVL